MLRAASCEACGAVNRPGQPYCDVCGAQLAGRPARVPVSAAVAAVPAGTQVIQRTELPVAQALPFHAGQWDLAYVAASLAFAVAVFVRFYRLGDIPEALHAAEDTFRGAASSGWIGLWSETAGGQPAGFAYVLAVWGEFFGDTSSGYRLLAATIGLATVGIFYLLSRSLLGRPAAIYGSLLLAFSAWHLGYSRLSLPVISLLLLELVAAHLLLLALRETRMPARQTRILVLAGVAFGAGAYFHNVFFVFAVAVLLLWVREALAGEYPAEAVLRRSLAFFIPALVVTLPYLGNLAFDSGKVVDHVRAVAVSRAPRYPVAGGVGEGTSYVLGNIARTAFGVVWRPKRGGWGEVWTAPGSRDGPAGDHRPVGWSSELAKAGAPVSIDSDRSRRCGSGSNRGARLVREACSSYARCLCVRGVCAALAANLDERKDA